VANGIAQRANAGDLYLHDIAILQETRRVEADADTPATFSGRTSNGS
jgi:hypothetical protein